MNRNRLWKSKEWKSEVLPDGMDDGEAELALRQIFGEALVVRVLLQTQVGKVVTDLEKTKIVRKALI